MDDYLREEVLAEGRVRNLPVFSDFLRMAALGDTGVVNISNIARECGVAASTAREHFQKGAHQAAEKSITTGFPASVAPVNK